MTVRIDFLTVNYFISYPFKPMLPVMITGPFFVDYAAHFYAGASPLA